MLMRITDCSPIATSDPWSLKVMPMPLQLKLPPWRHLLSYRLAGPLAVSLAALVIATT